ncbi:MAG TPA: DUF192 domain-containing protein [Tahibacter sp.]|nr:DUF192 domain-containing protein [Tahibacter sp.]
MSTRVIRALGALALVACSTLHAQAVSYVVLKDHRFIVELADDDNARTKGLMNRAHMGKDRGMLFTFPDEAPLAFWMKNTLIPLDILFFDKQMRLVSVQQNVQPCKADPCQTYPSAGPAQYVLELNAGLASKLAVKPGDKLDVHR